MKLSLSLLDMSSDVPHTKSRLCGGLLKKGDKGISKFTQHTNATIVSQKRTLSSVTLALTWTNIQAINLKELTYLEGAVTAETSKNGNKTPSVMLIVKNNKYRSTSTPINYLDSCRNSILLSLSCLTSTPNFTIKNRSMTRQMKRLKRLTI